MTYLPAQRSDQKLPRGSFFYVQIGSRFYAGEQALIVEKEIDPRFASTLTYHDKNGSFSREYLRNIKNRWGLSRGLGPRGPRAARNARKGKNPNYAKSDRITSEKIKQKHFTNQLSPKLVDTVDEAKKYRRIFQAQKACERLKVVYGSLGINVSIRHVKGEDQ